jgi:hypothetical protein
LAEPPAHLDAGVAAHQALEAEARREFVPQGLPAGEIDPGVELGVGQAERHRREVGPARMLAFPVVVRAVVGLGVARGDLVERIERADALAGGEVLHLDAAVAHLLDALGEALGAGVEAGEVARPGGDHGDLDPVLHDGRCRGGRGLGRGRRGGRLLLARHDGGGAAGADDDADGGAGEKVTTIHGLLPGKCASDASGGRPVSGPLRRVPLLGRPAPPGADPLAKPYDRRGAQAMISVCPIPVCPWVPRVGFAGL